MTPGSCSGIWQWLQYRNDCPGCVPSLRIPGHPRSCPRSSLPASSLRLPRTFRNRPPVHRDRAVPNRTVVRSTHPPSRTGTIRAMHR
uniref:Uncharacterized protein n=1 Tax=Anopheles minimus TaxID=112268 RepID=A0A182WNR9_9DIPT